mgnify:CR=1 FL=1
MTSSTMPSIECALSGVVPDPDMLEDAAGLPPDAAPGLPVGWTQITIIRRRMNPAWEAVQEVKDLSLHQLLALSEEGARAAIEPALVIQVEATFAALEAQPEYAPTLLDQTCVHIAPVEDVEGGSRMLEDEIKGLCAILGVDSDFLLREYEEEEDEGADEEEEDEGADAPDIEAPTAATG